MTTGEITAWGGSAVLIIGAIGAQVRLYRLMTNEFRFARKRQYEIHDAVKDTGKAVVEVQREANNAYREANHVNVKITDLNKRLIEQGKLAEQASEELPRVHQAVEETKAVAETTAATTRETQQIARDIHDKLPEP